MVGLSNAVGTVVVREFVVAVEGRRGCVSVVGCMVDCSFGGALCFFSLNCVFLDYFCRGN